MQDSLAAFTDAMLLALPVALILYSALAAWFMRSLKYGVAAVAPILLVVGWVYGFIASPPCVVPGREPAF